jgi:hypothetical protein
MVTQVVGDEERVIHLTLSQEELATLIDCIDLQTDFMEHAQKNVTTGNSVLVSTLEQMLEMHHEYAKYRVALQKARNQLHDQHSRNS